MFLEPKTQDQESSLGNESEESNGKKGTGSRKRRELRKTNRSQSSAFCMEHLICQCVNVRMCNLL